MTYKSKNKLNVFCQKNKDIYYETIQLVIVITIMYDDFNSLVFHCMRVCMIFVYNINVYFIIISYFENLFRRHKVKCFK